MGMGQNCLKTSLISRYQGKMPCASMVRGLRRQQMQIEVASTPNTPPKEKGDLLEKFAKDFLRTQNYEVETQVRVTAAELDLLCKHRVNGRTLFDECEAHRDPLSSNELKNLLGTLILKN